MKRRRFIQGAAAAPAVSTVLAQQPSPRAGIGPAPLAASEESPRLEFSPPDAVAEMMPRFFNTAQMAALRRLAELIMPAIGKAPGASEAKAAEFLDFLLSQSPADRQLLYTTGLDSLNAKANKQYGKAFAAIDPAQADALLAPLREPWTDPPPSDPFARLLVTAKQDIRTATMNSKEYSSVASAGSRRSGAGMGLYWNPIL